MDTQAEAPWPEISRRVGERIEQLRAAGQADEANAVDAAMRDALEARDESAAWALTGLHRNAVGRIRRELGLKPRRGGRQAPPQGARVSVTFWCRPDLAARVVAEAEARGLPQGAVIEAAIEAAIDTAS